MLPDVASGNLGVVGGVLKIHTEYGEVFWPVDDCIFGVFHGLVEEFGKASRVEVAQEFAVFLERVRGARELAVHNGLEGRNFEFRDGNVGVRAFLNIDETDFNGSAVKAGDGTTAVQEEMIQQVLAVVRIDSFFYLAKNHLVVFVVTVCRFRDDFARDFRDFVLVVAVNFDAGVTIAGVLAVEIRAACCNGGNQRQEQADGGMEFAKFFVTVKRKVQVRAL